jgi:hypothetical protein
MMEILARTLLRFLLLIGSICVQGATKMMAIMGDMSINLGIFIT